MDNTRNAALERLNAFIGSWRVEASFPVTEDQPAGSDAGAARSVFEWVLGGRFVAEHSIGPHPAPDSLAIIAFDPDGGAYRQHYFDSRGVVRVYAMTFNDGVWTLLRDSPDFSPPAFSQRFIGVLPTLLPRRSTRLSGAPLRLVAISMPN
jgi:hypothetical protein